MIADNLFAEFDIGQISLFKMFSWNSLIQEPIADTQMETFRPARIQTSQAQRRQPDPTASGRRLEFLRDFRINLFESNSILK